MGEWISQGRPQCSQNENDGAGVIPVTCGTRTLKDAMNEALRDWTARVYDTHYLIGTVAGPHPYPTLVRDLQRVIGDETKQIRHRRPVS